MTYIALINTTDVSCETDQLLLTEDQVHQVETVVSLLNEISQLKNDEQQYIENAKAQGFEKGYKEGLNKSREETNLLFAEYLESITKKVIDTHTLSYSSIIDLTLNIVRKIAFDIGPEDMITGIARRAIKNLKSDKPLEIKVNAELAAIVEKKLNHLETMNNNGTIMKVEVVADPSMDTLDCVISSYSGVTVASFDQQLQFLKLQLNRPERLSNPNL